jgi:hypothetical protein
VLLGPATAAAAYVPPLTDIPLRLGGCLDPSGAEKAARFVRMCNALGVPLLVLADSPGLLPAPAPPTRRTGAPNFCTPSPKRSCPASP